MLLFLENSSRHDKNFRDSSTETRNESDLFSYLTICLPLPLCSPCLCGEFLFSKYDGTCETQAPA